MPLIDTANLPKQLEDMIGYNIDQLIDKVQLSNAQQELVKNFLNNLNDPAETNATMETSKLSAFTDFVTSFSLSTNGGRSLRND